MSWASLDDGFADHPKVLPLSSDAFRLHVCAMCWCNRRGTDGKVVLRDLRILAGMIPGDLDAARLVLELTGARLWDVTDDGWLLHDFLDWNEPAAKVKAKREAHAQRVKEARDKAREAAQEKARDLARDASRDIARAPSPSPPIPSHPLPEELSSSFAGGSSPPRPAVESGQTSEPPSPRTPAPIQGSRPAAQGSLLPAELALAPTAKPARRPKSPKQLSTTALAWQAYAEAYEARYRTLPEQNGQVMGQLARLVANVRAKAPLLVRYYLTRNDSRYNYHPIGPLLSDYQKLVTAMETGRVVTDAAARDKERASAVGDSWDARIKQREREEENEVIDVESRPEQV